MSLYKCKLCECVRDDEDMRAYHVTGLLGGYSVCGLCWDDVFGMETTAFLCDEEST